MPAVRPRKRDQNRADKPKNQRKFHQINDLAYFQAIQLWRPAVYGFWNQLLVFRISVSRITFSARETDAINC